MILIYFFCADYRSEIHFLNAIFTFIVCGEEQTFIYKGEVYNHDTRSANNFHLPITNLTKYQKGAHYAGIKKILIIFLLT
jgi:hypothetical protein